VARVRHRDVFVSGFSSVFDIMTVFVTASFVRYSLSFVVIFFIVIVVIFVGDFDANLFPVQKCDHPRFARAVCDGEHEGGVGVTQ